MKVADLAKALNISSKELIDFYQANGQEITSHLNTITDEQINMAREMLVTSNANAVDVIHPAGTPIVPVTFDKERLVPCRSITAGSLYMEGIRTQTLYKWVSEGDVIDVEYQDIEAAVRRNSDYVMRPLFIIDDEEVVERFPQLKKLYDNMYSLADLRGVILNLDVNSMKATILSLPIGAQESIKNLASSMIASGQLDSIKKVKALDEIFNTQLTLMTELF